MANLIALSPDEVYGVGEVPAGMLGQIIETKDGDKFQLVTNGDGIALAQNQCLKWTSRAAFTVELCENLTDLVCGVMRTGFTSTVGVGESCFVQVAGTATVICDTGQTIAKGNAVSAGVVDGTCRGAALGATDTEVIRVFARGLEAIASTNTGTVHLLEDHVAAATD